MYTTYEDAIMYRDAAEEIRNWGDDDYSETVGKITFYAKRNY